MSDVTIKVDSAAMINRLDAIGRQAPFALAMGVNRTLEEAQRGIQAHMSGTYQIRRPWVLQGIKIDNADRATKDRPRGVVHLDPDRGFLSKFEDGTTKTPQGRAIAIPITARRTKADLVRNDQRPKNLFKASTGYSSVRTGTTVWKGDKRTFMIQKRDGSGVIFQRVGKAERNRRRKANAARAAQGLDPLHRDPSLRVLFVLRTKAKTPANLDFYEVGERIARDRFVVNVMGFIGVALRTAK